MNRNRLKTYAPQARRDFIKAVTDRAAFYGLTKEKIAPVTEQGDVAIIGGKPFPRDVVKKRKRLEERIGREGFEQVMEAMAYTWFNRFVAIRYMELHGYLEHGYRVLSTTDYTPVEHPHVPSSGATGQAGREPGSTGQANDTNAKNRKAGPSEIPDILRYAEHVDLPELNQNKVVELKLAGNRDEELYRMLLIAQCNVLHKAMPFLFEWIGDATELLLPENLLHSDSLIRKMVNDIPEAEWKEVEIIGWLYQFYISEKKDQVIGKVVKSEDIPAATQLFTPNWIVKYMVQNTLGRQWVATYPNSPLKQMEYYIEPAEQTPEVQEKLKAITPESLNPEELTLLDPACGSGHILVEAYNLLKAIYQERGYRAKDIPRLILEKNLYGLEIDDRAAQLAAFALMMKARADDRRIFNNGTKPHVLAIQESKGMDAEKITEALNAPIVKGDPLPREMLFEEMDDARAPLFSRKNLSVKGEISQDDMAQLIQLFEHGKTFGSLIRVPEDLHEKLVAIADRVEDVLAYGEMFGKAAAEALRPIVEQAGVLCGKYNAVVANPPYMGGKGMNGRLSAWAKDNYPDSKSDLFAMFIERGLEMVPKGAYSAMVTMQSWMFLSSYEKLRQGLLSQTSIECMSHMANMVMGIAFGTAATVWRNAVDLGSKGAFCYVEYEDIGESNKPVAFPPVNERNKAALKSSLPTAHCPLPTGFYRASAANFRKIPGSPIAYWVSDSFRQIFATEKPLGKEIEAKQGLATGDNDRFLRYCWEVSYAKVSFSCLDIEECRNDGKKWFPINKGGSFRKWYGNIEFLISFDKTNRAILKTMGNHLPSENKYLLPSISWSDVTSATNSFRYFPAGFLFDATGHSAFPTTEKEKSILTCYCNNKFVNAMTKILNPTMHFHVGYFNILPFPSKLYDNIYVTRFLEIFDGLISMAKSDWDSYETSWDFTILSLLCPEHRQNTLAAAYTSLRSHWRQTTLEMQKLEEENNRIFIEAYGLQDKLTPDVPLLEITLTCNPHYRYGGNKSDEELEALLLTDTIKELISYAVGCMMARYSLDQPGLIYAHSGNDQLWEIYHEKHNKPAPPQNNNHPCDSWSTFPPDEDSIIPITDTDWFPDDAANRFIEFISVAWPKEHLEENLKFVAESLGPNRNESPRETIRRYVSTGFFKHHMKIYKKRPIYWLFSSGKLRAFHCLVYLHRYKEGTLSRMRTEYVIPLQGKIAARIEQLSGDIRVATSTAYSKKLGREQDKLAKQQAELQTFDEKLRHYADQRIILDLDDGVKVNYGKFGDLLVEVKAVTGKK